MSWFILLLLVVLFVLLASGRSGGHTRFHGGPSVPWDDEDDEQ